MKNAIILFTRVPVEGRAKTRLAPFLSNKNSSKLQIEFIKDIFQELKLIKAKIIVAYSDDGELELISDIFDLETEFILQRGNSLGEKMMNSFKDVLKNHEKAILIGSDIPLISSVKIKEQFLNLKDKDVVISPTYDGGYYLIGLKKPNDNILEIDYKSKNVFLDTIAKIKKENLSFSKGERLLDVDDENDFLELKKELEKTNKNKARYTKEFISTLNLSTTKFEKFRKEFSNFDKFLKDFEPSKTESFKLLARGEYNVNHIFYSNKKSKDILLRYAISSQMNLDRQIYYEYQNLKILEKSNCTPKAYAVYEEKDSEKRDFLLMEYLNGTQLDYNNDLDIAARILAKIHSLDVADKNHLFNSKKPESEILKESESLFQRYKNSKYASQKTVKVFQKLIDKAREISIVYPYKKNIINTELNSGNFLINKYPKNSYLVDWEKAIYGYSIQDLGHFLAPTTTFWKSDDILNSEQIDFFLDEYNRNLRKSIDKKDLFSGTNAFISLNCIRGLSWCLMAYTEYAKKDIEEQNSYSFQKIKKYIEIEFMENIYEKHFNK